MCVMQVNFALCPCMTGTPAAVHGADALLNLAISPPTRVIISNHPRVTLLLTLNHYNKLSLIKVSNSFFSSCLQKACVQSVSESNSQPHTAVAAEGYSVPASTQRCAYNWKNEG